MVSPCLRVSQPMPPPSVRPPTPVWPTMPAGHGEPVRLGGRVEVGEQRPAADADPRGPRVDRDLVASGSRSITSPSSTTL